MISSDTLSQPELHSEFWAILDYRVRLFQKKKKPKIYNPSIPEAETGGSPSVCGDVDYHSARDMR